MRIELPKGAKFILDSLKAAGFTGYVVGGCVRDACLGIEPHDWDITTSARPEQVKAIFKKTIDTGLKHGTVTVLTDRNLSTDGINAFEVTTYRVDGEYEDHRRPAQVTFADRLEDDLSRRDFTINAMAYNETEGLVDCFGGQEDLSNKLVRCVGNPDERFSEDALRILRAVRFAAKLGFEIDESTVKSIRSHAEELKFISAERIREELTKLLCSPHPEMIRNAYEYGLTKVFLPEFDRCMETAQNNPYHMYSVGEHTIKVMEHIPPEVHLRYTALLHDIDKPKVKTTDKNGIDHFYDHARYGAETAGRILKRLKFDNDTIKRVKRLVKWHDFGVGSLPKEQTMRGFLAELGPENYEDFIAIKRADMAGQSDYRAEEKQAVLESIMKMHDDIMSRGDCLSLKELALGGDDLKKLGIPEGKKLGETLNKLFVMVLADPSLNTREKLTEIVGRL
ncbi:MAG: HDIG domain-containing protein [Lachnospiraceae bacterium]|nr:HDIG domain-containing protein [Lachnospiraceae bacterium]